MHAKLLKLAWLGKPRKLPSGSGRSMRPIRQSSVPLPLWYHLIVPGLLLLALLLQGCATNPTRYVVVSANRGCSAVFEKFTDAQIEQATKEARVKMIGHNEGHRVYCRKS
jgi:hypothetical protein